MPDNALIAILDKLTIGQIDIEEANRQLDELNDIVPKLLACQSCRTWKRDHPDLPERWRQTGHHGLCVHPAQPPHVEHEDSMRCGWYEKYDPRDEALPFEVKPSGSKMFK